MRDILIAIPLIVFILWCYTIVSDTPRVEERSCDVIHESIDPRVHGPKCRQNVPNHGKGSHLH